MFVRVWLVGWYNRPPMLWTNRGYNKSVIFSLLANSSARSNGILHLLVSSLFYKKKKKKTGREETYQTPFKCMGPILTTWRIFSLFKIPSRRPRVIPATLSSLVPLIIWLSLLVSINELQGWGGEEEKLTLSTGNTDALGFHLITEAAFIFP